MFDINRKIQSTLQHIQPSPKDERDNNAKNGKISC